MTTFATNVEARLEAALPGQRKRPQPMTARDQQRAKLYRAENVTRLKEGISGRSFTTVADMQTYVDRLIASAWFQRRWGKKVKAVIVKDGRGRRNACAGRVGGIGARYIKMPLWSRNEIVLLHEMAHHCGGLDYEHRWQFAAAFLDLVTHQIGKEAGDSLRRNFKAAHVRWKPKRTVTLTDEQRAAIGERLAAARLAAKEQDQPRPLCSAEIVGVSMADLSDRVVKCAVTEGHEGDHRNGTTRWKNEASS